MIDYKPRNGVEDDCYDEEEDLRPLINYKARTNSIVEKPDPDMLHALYENVLQKLIYLIESINEDGLGFVFKIEVQRIYNLLMAVVVNDKEKSGKVPQLLGQGFNRLMDGPHDDFFMELGVPEEWSKQKLATLLTPETFKEQMDQFQEADEGLSWQWFSDFDMKEFTSLDQRATGVFVTMIDITAGQTAAAQQEIQKRLIESRNHEQRKLAIRLTAGRTITRVLRNKLDGLKKLENDERRRRNLNVFEIDKLAKTSRERVSMIKSHAKIAGIDQLLQLSQVNSVMFIDRLQRAYQKVNYLQELMIVKAFSNSIEITKAITFMGELCSLHTAYS